MALIKIKRGQEANLPTLNEGEFAFTTDTHKVFIGDGTNNHQVDFSDAERTKLSGIADNADVTNFTNVSSALAAATSDVSFNSYKITSVANPANDQDAATKAYVDSVATGLDVKASVRVASTANIDLSTGGLLTIDDIALNDGDRVLVKDQTTASENGIYVAHSGAWARATDADSSDEVTAGMFTFVEEGTTNADKGFVLTTNNPITLGTTDLSFSQFSGVGSGGANTSLSNLASVAINAALVPGTAGALDFGSSAKPWANIYIAGTSGTPATNQFKLTGASTGGLRTITLPDASGTALLDTSTIDGGSF